MSLRNIINSNFWQIVRANTNGNITTLDTANLANVNLGNVSKIKIAGGSLGQVLSTDGAGNLFWATSGGGGGGNSNYIVNGNSSVFIPAADGNINIIANAVSSAVFTEGGANIPGNLEVTGNLDVLGNLNANTITGNLAQLTAGNTTVVLDTDANITLTANGNAMVTVTDTKVNLGSNGNVKITGGSNGQALFTDGAGNLTWVTISSAKISNGTSNVNLPTANGNLTVSIGGTDDVLIVGNSNSTLNGNLFINGNIEVTNGANLGNVAKVKITGGSNLQYLQTDGNGNLAWVGISTSRIFNGNSNVTVAPNGNITMSSAGNANIVVVTGQGVTINGNILSTGNLVVQGNTTTVNTNTLVVQDPIIQEGGGANGDPLTTNDGKDRGLLQYYFTTAPVTAFMGWDNSAAEFALGSEVTDNNSVITFNQYGNLRAGSYFGDNVSLTGNIESDAGNFQVAGNSSINIIGRDYAQLEWANDYANATSASTADMNALWVDINGISFYNNASGANAIAYFDTNGIFAAPTLFANTLANVANLKVRKNADLGDVANITISGGSDGQALFTDGAGNLSWVTISADKIVNGTSNVVVAANANITVGSNGVANVVTVSARTNPTNYTSTAIVALGATVIPLDTVAGLSIGQVLNAPTFLAPGTTVTAINALNVTVSSATLLQVPSGTTFFTTAPTSLVGIAGNLTVAGNLSAGSNLTVGANLAVVGKSNLGAVGNITVTGGSNGQFLKTDGTGNLSWGNLYASMASDVFTATANQTTFTVSQVPVGNVSLFINGVLIGANAANANSTTINYVSANNGNYTMVAGDRVTVSYMYGTATPITLPGNSGYVVNGTAVTLGNLSARVPSTGNRALQLATLSGTMSVFGSGEWKLAANSATNTANAKAITTTFSYLNSDNWAFTGPGTTEVWDIFDNTTKDAWTIKCIYGAAMAGSIISIQRIN